MHLQNHRQLTTISDMRCKKYYRRDFMTLARTEFRAAKLNINEPSFFSAMPAHKGCRTICERRIHPIAIGLLHSGTSSLRTTN